MKDINNLIGLFEKFAYPQNYANAFIDLLDQLLIAFKWYENREEQIAARTALASHAKKEQLVALFTAIGELSEGFSDPIGSLYEQLISKGGNGQFFTPEPIAEFMAHSIVTEDAPADHRVCDPACGSGRMLLAVAKINRHLRFYGADIDEVCCKMSVVNLLLNSLSGEIAHMDTLANDFHKGYAVSTILADGYHYPCYREFTDPEESYIWLRPMNKPAQDPAPFNAPFSPTKSPLMSRGIQGSLFD